MTTIRTERSTDIVARETILDTAYGVARFTKPSARLRDGRLPAEDLALVAVERGRVVGTLRLWNVTAGPGCPALLLGPLAVEPSLKGEGIGKALMLHAISEAKRLGHKAILLVGDASYYGRFGFSAEATGGLWLPGPYEKHRLLACELVAGALDGARGLIRTPQPVPSRLAPLVAAMSRRRRPATQAA